MRVGGAIIAAGLAYIAWRAWGAPASAESPSSAGNITSGSLPALNGPADGLSPIMASMVVYGKEAVRATGASAGVPQVFLPGFVP